MKERGRKEKNETLAVFITFICRTKRVAREKLSGEGERGGG